MVEVGLEEEVKKFSRYSYPDMTKTQGGFTLKVWKGGRGRQRGGGFDTAQSMAGGSEHAYGVSLCLFVTIALTPPITLHSPQKG